MDKEMQNKLEKQIVSTQTVFSYDDSFTDSRFMKIRCAVMHSGVNRNKSSFSKEVIEAAKDSFQNIPILADVQEYTDTDGNQVLDYTGHSMHLEDDKYHEGKQKIIYDERIVGIIPQTNNFEMVYNEADDNYFVYVDALLYRDYGNYVCDILESRGNVTDVSVEVFCDKVSYSADRRVLEVESFTASGVTLLGEMVEPGMKNAHAIAFSLDENSRHEQLIQIMQELKESLDNYTKEYQRKEDVEVENQEILMEEVEETTEETVIAETEETTEETTPEVEETFVEENFEEEDSDESDSNDGIDAQADQDDDDEDDEEEEEQEDVINDDEQEKRVFEMTRTFAVSHEDIKFALYNLLAPIEEDKNDYYWINQVYDDHFVAQGCCGSYIGCKYAVDGDNVSLVGEPYELFAEFLTKEERAALELMRSNYSSIESELNTYKKAEEEAAKDALFVAEEYASISDNAEFKALAENHAMFSLDELTEKLDSIQLNAAKHGALKFSVEEPEKKANVYPFATFEHKTSFLDGLLKK